MKAMKKHSDESLKVKPFDSQPLKTTPKPHLRYLGFESIEGGRRLRFAVKSVGHESVEVTVDIVDATFTSARGISIQDAAPMAYEKIVELLTTQDRVDSNQLALTDADVAHYLSRHLSTQKSAFSMTDRRRSNIAA
jgi:hypothetical protein